MFMAACSDIISVLREAQNHNSRDWYMQNKEKYRAVHAFLSDLYFALGNRLHESVNIDINPRKSISRPYNDQRFGNKPYLRDNLWVTFQTADCPAPAFFIEFSPYGIRMGMGYYAATPAQMRELRAKIDHDPRGFADVLEKALRDKELRAMGEPYKKRHTSNYEGLMGEIYNYRNIYFQKVIPEERWEQLEDIAYDTFLSLIPMYKLFAEKM